MKTTTALLAMHATTSHAWGGYYSGGDDSTSEPYFGYGLSFSSYHRKLIAHAVLATVAFGFMFPAGGILIRLGNFRGLWLVHGLWQLFAYSAYIAAFGLGVFVGTSRFKESKLWTLNIFPP